jgi:hypothetical protein
VAAPTREAKSKNASGDVGLFPEDGPKSEPWTLSYRPIATCLTNSENLAILFGAEGFAGGYKSGFARHKADLRA